MKIIRFGLICALLTGCAALGDPPLDTPPEFNQTVYLNVDDSYKTFQATMSTYDIGDLQNFHSQHTLPVLVEDAFREIFGTVKKYKPEPGFEMDTPGVPAIFEVKFVDLANDLYNEADNYRAVATIAVAMKSPRGNVMWQKAFRANGYARVDPQDSIQIGPQDAVIDAVHEAIGQMQQAIIASPEVRDQMKYYLEVDRRIRAEKAQSGSLTQPDDQKLT